MPTVSKTSPEDRARSQRRGPRSRSRGNQASHCTGTGKTWAGKKGGKATGRRHLHPLTFGRYLIIMTAPPWLVRRTSVAVRMILYLAGKPLTVGLSPVKPPPACAMT